MKKNKILHVMILDKFLAPFIDFIDEYFGRENHHYVFINNQEYRFGLTREHNVEFLNTDDEIFITLLGYMQRAEKIILHGLWRDRVDILLYFNQELLKKCYWIMWGGDFYFPEKQTKIRHEVIKNMGYLVTGTTGDYVLAREWYDTQGQHLNWLGFYPSNLYVERDIIRNDDDECIVILVGNSATRTNNHFEIFESLLKFKNDNIKLLVPLSYGDSAYAESVIKKGHALFSDKFFPLTKFIPLEEYMNILMSVDIAVFKHNRQQAAGNTIQLLGMGKKVYLDKRSTLNNVFRERGINVFDCENIDLSRLNPQLMESNIKLVKHHFSSEKLVHALTPWFK